MIHTFKDGDMPKENKSFVERLLDENNHHVMIETERGFVHIIITNNNVYDKNFKQYVGNARFEGNRVFIEWLDNIQQ